MIDLLRALHLGRVMREVLVDGKGEVEEAALVHAFVGFDGEGEVEDVVGVGEVHFHGTSQGQFLEVYPYHYQLALPVMSRLSGRRLTSLHTQLRWGDLLLLLPCCPLRILSLLLLLFLFPGQSFRFRLRLTLKSLPETRALTFCPEDTP